MTGRLGAVMSLLAFTVSASAVGKRIIKQANPIHWNLFTYGFTIDCTIIKSRTYSCVTRRLGTVLSFLGFTVSASVVRKRTIKHANPIHWSLYSYRLPIFCAIINLRTYHSCVTGRLGAVMSFLWFTVSTLVVGKRIIKQVNPIHWSWYSYGLTINGVILNCSHIIVVWQAAWVLWCHC